MSVSPITHEILILIRYKQGTILDTIYTNHDFNPLPIIPTMHAPYPLYTNESLTDCEGTKLRNYNDYITVFNSLCAFFAKWHIRPLALFADWHKSFNTIGQMNGTYLIL